MNKLYIFAVGVICSFVLMNIDATAQAFRKGSLLISASEGTTWSKYTTGTTNTTNDVLHHENINGDRDPLTLEYGITDHLGIGINMGGDVFRVDPSKFYNFQASTHNVKVFMSEFTFDGNYHFYVTKKLDLCAFTSLGFSSVTFKGNDGDHSYNYEAGGGIIRVGAKAKYYFFRRFGVMGMLSAFSANCSSKGVKGNTVGEGYNTSIKGAALEFGLCYRILR